MAHNHCGSCFSSSCSSFQGCLFTSCPECSLNFHECKLWDHQTICPEARVPCINKDYGCAHILKRCNMPRHLTDECPLLQSEKDTSADFITCEHCSQSLPEVDLNDHYLICDFIPVPCSNASFGCTETLRRIDINTHLRSCPASIVQCLYSHTRSKNQDTIFPIKEEAHQLPDEKFRSHDMEVDVKSQSLAFDVRRHKPYYPLLSDSDDHSALARGKGVSRSGSFVCGRFVRRDQVESHWLSHAELIDDLPFKIQRCPMTQYGCTHGTVFFYPLPVGHVLDYNKELGSFYIKPLIPIKGPSKEDELSNSRYATDIAKKQELALYGYGEDGGGSFDVLGQLPLEVLLEILSHLDSLSLWCLSQVNRFLRSVCEGLLGTRGIVYFYWILKVSDILNSKWKECHTCNNSTIAISSHFEFFFFRMTKEIGKKAQK